MTRRLTLGLGVFAVAVRGRRAAVLLGVLAVLVVCSGNLTAAGAEARGSVTVRGLKGTGEWMLSQDYGDGLGIRFDQHFAFEQAAAIARLPLDGGSAVIDVRETVTSKASGAYGIYGPSGLTETKHYTCEATATTTARARSD